MLKKALLKSPPKTLLALSLAAGLVIGGFALVQLTQPPLNIEIADEPAERELGLSGRASLDPNAGLLFDFKTLGYHGIWMKDMAFAIDIIWMDQSQRVVHIEKNVAPATYPHTFKPTQLAYYVLEVNAGWADNHDLKVGDKLNL